MGGNPRKNAHVAKADWRSGLRQKPVTRERASRDGDVLPVCWRVHSGAWRPAGGLAHTRSADAMPACTSSGVNRRSNLALTQFWCSCGHVAAPISRA